MALSSTQIKWIAIITVVVIAVIIVASLLWEVIKIVAGVVIGGGLIYLGLRFLFGGGFPKPIAKFTNRWTDGDSNDDD